MKRATWFAVSIAALVLAVLPTIASAQAAKPKNQLLPNATVKSVSASSVVVTTLGKEQTFTVDARTQVVGKGIGTKSKSKDNKPSIVDLLKLLDLDSSLAARKELAKDLNVHVGADGSAEQNIALSKAVWVELAKNGGQVPDSLRN